MWSTLPQTRHTIRILVCIPLGIPGFAASHSFVNAREAGEPFRVSWLYGLGTVIGLAAIA